MNGRAESFVPVYQMASAEIDIADIHSWNSPEKVCASVSSKIFLPWCRMSGICQHNTLPSRSETYKVWWSTCMFNIWYRWQHIHRRHHQRIATQNTQLQDPRWVVWPWTWFDLFHKSGVSRAPQQIFSVRATPSLQRFAAIYSPSATTYIVRLLILCEKLHVAIAI